MAARRSIAVRAAIALVLMVFFYAAAVGAIVGLILLGKLLLGLLADIRGRGVFLIAIAGGASLVAAGVVAWSVLPRPDKFEPPGPEITRAEQPALFAEIDRVATATAEAGPAHVYLVNEVNAFVTQRGGLMGFGSRRVMGIGLPLMRTLNVSELRAVLAHEMGHFYGGDTRLGPWIYKTRGSMIRTVVNLSRAGEGSAEVSEVAAFLFLAVQAPFRWFAEGFLWVSQAVSRAQEYSADGVAVRTEGSAAMIGGLQKTHAAAVAHQIYLRNELAPLIDRGVLPPVGEGFSCFLGTARVAELLSKVVDDELETGTQDPYDSHPPLRQRIAAAAALDGPTVAPDERPAISLLIEPEQYESAAIRKLVDQRLEAVAWDATGAVWIGVWREAVKENRVALADLTIATLSRDRRALRSLAAKVHGGAVDDANDDNIRSWVTNAVATALAVRLVEGGYQVDSRPGSPHRLYQGDREIMPWGEISDWLRGEGGERDLVERWAARGLADERLA